MTFKEKNTSDCWNTNVDRSLNPCQWHWFWKWSLEICNPPFFLPLITLFLKTWWKSLLSLQMLGEVWLRNASYRFKSFCMGTLQEKKKRSWNDFPRRLFFSGTKPTTTAKRDLGQMLTIRASKITKHLVSIKLIATNASDSQQTSGCTQIRAKSQHRAVW